MNDRYRVAPLLFEEARDGDVQVRSKLTGATTIVARETAVRMSECQSFKPLGVHARERFRDWAMALRMERGPVTLALSALREAAAAIAHTVRGRGAASTNPWLVEGALTSLADAGFIISDTELMQRLRSARRGSAQTAPRITSIVVPTRASSPQLLRCVKSFADSLAAWSRNTSIVISDDSGFPPGGTLAQPSGTATWLTTADRRAFAIRLAREAGVAAEVVEFALLPDHRHTYCLGSNRNTLLLATIGQSILSVDDDSLCQPVLLGEEGGLTLTSRPDAREFHFFASRERALDTAAAKPIDILSVFERYVARPLHDIVFAADEHAGAALQIEDANDALIEGIWRGSGHVYAVTTGLVGRSGQRWPRRHIIVDPRWGERLLTSDEFYRDAVTSQALAAASPRATVSNVPFLSGMFFALDNSVRLPPFLPRGRASDFLFGRMLSQVHLDAYTAQLPWALVHDPLDPRDCDLGELRTTIGIELAYLVLDVLRNAPGVASGGRPAERIVAMGETLRELATAPLPTFIAEMSVHASRRWRRQIQEIEQLLERYDDAPALWKVAAEDQLTALRFACASDLAPPPIDVSADAGAWPAAREICVHFGQLLRCWPQITEAATALARRGDGLH